MFEKYGRIANVKIPLNRDGDDRGYGYVRFFKRADMVGTSVEPQHQAVWSRKTLLGAPTAFAWMGARFVFRRHVHTRYEIVAAIMLRTGKNKRPPVHIGYAEVSARLLRSRSRSPPRRRSRSPSGYAASSSRPHASGSRNQARQSVDYPRFAPNE